MSIMILTFLTFLTFLILLTLLIQYIFFFVGLFKVVVVDVKSPPILSNQGNYKVFQAFSPLLDPDPVVFAGKIDVIFLWESVFS